VVHIEIINEKAIIMKILIPSLKKIRFSIFIISVSTIFFTFGFIRNTFAIQPCISSDGRCYAYVMYSNMWGYNIPKPSWEIQDCNNLTYTGEMDSWGIQGTVLTAYYWDTETSKWIATQLFYNEPAGAESSRKFTNYLRLDLDMPYQLYPWKYWPHGPPGGICDYLNPEKNLANPCEEDQCCEE